MKKSKTNIDEKRITKLANALFKAHREAYENHNTDEECAVESLFRQMMEAVSKDDLSLFEDAELDYQMFEITSR